MNTLNDMKKKDIEMVFAWMSQPEHEKIFGDAIGWKDEFEEHVGKSSWLSHFIFLKEEVPAGFCQFYDCTMAGEGPWMNESKGTFGIDFLLLEQYRGKGLGKTMISLLLQRIKLKEDAKMVIADPDVNNQASINLLKKCGFEKGRDELFRLNLMEMKDER